jgi:hypothetical protein
MENDTQIEKWLDPAISGLLNESKELSEQIAALEKELADLEKAIHFFQVRHTQELGDLLLRLLNLKTTIAAKKTAEQPQNINVKQEFEQAAKDEADFKSTYEDTIKKQIPELSTDQLSDLKKKRNRIARLLHDNPTIKEQFKKEANELMAKTNEAFKNNDIKTITEIFEYVEKGKPFKLSEKALTEADALAAEIKYKRSILARLAQEINELKNSDSYQTIKEIGDWDEYFTTTRAQLRVELEYLERQA